MFDFWIYLFFKVWLHAGRVPLLSARANFSYYVSLENALMRLRSGHLSSWDMHPVYLPEAIFLPCKRFVPERDYHPRESFRRYDLPENVNVERITREL